MAWARKVERIRAEVQGWPDLVLLGRTVLLAFTLPVVLRWLRVRALMRALTPPATRLPSPAPDVDRLVHLADLALGHLPLASNTCLVRSLVLYRLLRTDGVAVRIHFGVQKASGQLAGHSWLTHHGQLLAEPSADHAFTEIYAYPAASGVLGSEGKEERSLCAWPG